MAVERRKLESLGCSSRVVSTLLRPSTNQVYAKVWYKFSNSLVGRELDPSAPPLSAILDFLHQDWTWVLA